MPGTTAALSLPASSHQVAEVTAHLAVHASCDMRARCLTGWSGYKPALKARQLKKETTYKTSMAAAQIMPSMCRRWEVMAHLCALAGRFEQLAQGAHGSRSAHGLQVAAAEALGAAGHMGQVHILSQGLAVQHHLCALAVLSRTCCFSLWPCCLRSADCRL